MKLLDPWSFDNIIVFSMAFKFLNLGLVNMSLNVVTEI